MVSLELTPDLFNSLRVLVIAGGKSADTGDNGIIAAAMVLQMMAQAAQSQQVRAFMQPKMPEDVAKANGVHPEAPLN